MRYNSDWENDKIHWDILLAVIAFVSLLVLVFAIVGILVEIIFY